ncbi:Trehalose/maltose import ATP-binding protein MalK [Candidatus Burarchaeum australiense]|nr:Trehalose/maltose import ATP-binding protein MalK [Candidatus Burarchaeum australiense]
MAAIVTKNLTKTYGELKAVDALNLEVAEGEIFGLLGPNGAGKTTTISMLCTILAPTKGTALVNGHDIIREQSGVRSSIGIVFQEPSADDLLTGRENLEMHAELYAVPRAERKISNDEVLRIVELTSRANDQVKTYSGGMRRRLELGRGLLHTPRVLLLDEPTLGLDPQGREHIWKYITRIAREKRITVVITTHYMEEADMLCDRVGIMDHGKIVVLDTPANLKRKVGGDVVKVRAAGINEKQLRSHACVRSIAKKEGWYYVTVHDVTRNLPCVVKGMRDIKEIELHTVTLNDVFMKYTGRELREEPAEGDYNERMMQDYANHPNP